MDILFLDDDPDRVRMFEKRTVVRTAWMRATFVNGQLGFEHL